MKYKVYIPTSGVGSRLGHLTRHTNKALIDVGGRPVLQHILEGYSQHIPLVISLGFLADQVRNWLEQNYSDRTIEYVMVDKYSGAGSSLGYSMLQARAYLQCPFIFQACDTLLSELIPPPVRNWTGGYQMARSLRAEVGEHYRTQIVGPKDSLTAINSVGARVFDYIHIGITGVHDFEAWWGELGMIYRHDPSDSTLTDTHVISSLLQKGYNFTVVPYKTWFDTGNPEALQNARKSIAQKV